MEADAERKKPKELKLKQAQKTSPKTSPTTSQKPKGKRSKAKVAAQIVKTKCQGKV